MVVGEIVRIEMRDEKTKAIIKNLCKQAQKDVKKYPDETDEVVVNLVRDVAENLRSHYNLAIQQSAVSFERDYFND